MGEQGMRARFRDRARCGNRGVSRWDLPRPAPRPVRMRDEHGQVLVLVSLVVIPIFLMISVIVVDVGNWWVHDRRAQTLVDSGAFAGATKFVGCSFQFGDPVAANLAIRAAGLEYSGDTGRYPGTRNLQEQEPDDLRVVLNSARYWQDGDPLDGTGLDDTRDPDGNPLTPGDPCTTRSLDVKATDDDAPLLFGWIPFVADPKAVARVEIRQVLEQSGMLPWAVPEVDPAAVVAIFVDENDGEVVATQLLMKKDDVTLPFLEWTTPSAPFGEPVPITSENTGVVILVSKVNDDPFRTPGPPGTLTDICTQDPGLVTCYAGDGNQDGLTFIHGWSSAAGAPADPQIRDVTVTNLTCTQDLSGPYFLRANECDLGATAVIDFGVTGNPSAAPPGGIGAVVTLKAPGCGNNGCDMAYSGPASSPTESIWITTESATLDDKFFGRANFSIEWETESPAGTGNDDTWAGVAHPYVANGASGPIEYLKLANSDGAPDSNSREQGPPDRNVIVTVGLNKPFQIESPLAPPVVLRVASPSGSQNQAFDCDENVNFANEIEIGCRTTYRENYGDWDKDGFSEWQDILCNDYPNGAGLPPAPTDPVPDCVRVETGDKIGQFRSGLKSRFKNPTCAPNNWPEELSDFDDFFTTYDLANDPRYVTLIVTDYGAFMGQGSSTAVPVKYFAGFYVTGWDKVGNAPECPDNEPHPWYGTNYPKSLDNGDVWGHFINIVLYSSTGVSDDQLCNFDEVGTCIAVLVE